MDSLQHIVITSEQKKSLRTSESSEFFLITKFSGPVTNKDMQTPLRSGNLDIRDAQRDEIKDTLKKSYYIISRF